jgi:hypothetical protein
MKLSNGAAVYTISAKGRIPETWMDVFGDFSICVIENGPITILTGKIEDQTALLGVLQNLYTLGLVLVNVCCDEIPDIDPVKTNEENSK